MAVYRFSLSAGAGECSHAGQPPDLPPEIHVMYAGECVGNAELAREGYVCDLPDEFAAKLQAGKLEQMFVYEPPLVGGDPDEDVERELVSILLVSASRKDPI